MWSQLVLLGVLLGLSQAVLPPGFEDELYCPPNACLEARVQRFGFVGPGRMFKQCNENGEISDVVTWGTQANTEDEKQELLSQGYHQEACPEPSCGANEEWTECKSGSCFDDTCETFGKLRACTMDCRKGCTCKDGFVREGEDCVSVDTCQADSPTMPSCGANEEWTECKSGSCFDDTCETFGKLRPCTMDCRKGCTCKDGFVREGEDCVSVDTCQADSPTMGLETVSQTNSKYALDFIRSLKGSELWEPLQGAFEEYQAENPLPVVSPVIPPSWLRPTQPVFNTGYNLGYRPYRPRLSRSRNRVVRNTLNMPYLSGQNPNTLLRSPVQAPWIGGF